MLRFMKTFTCILTFGVLACSSLAQSQSDLASMITLLDHEKISTLKEAKELREHNQSNAQQAALFDYSYSIILMNFGRWQEAIEVLQPFVEKRPQVFRARLLLIRAYIELDKFDNAASEFEKLLEALPTDSEGTEEIARKAGVFIAFLKLARSADKVDELYQKLEPLAETKIPEPAKVKFQEGMASVSRQVEKLNADMQRQTEKAEEETEAKIESNLADAEKLKSEAEAKQAELQSREKDRLEKLEQVRRDLAKLELTSTNLLARQNLLDNQILNATRMQQNLVQNVTIQDQNGNRVTRQEISNPQEYNRLDRMIANYSAELLNNQAQGRQLLANYRALQNQAAKMASQKELDQMFTTSKMNDLTRAAESKQKRAERDADRKSKLAETAAKSMHFKLKNYGTYETLSLVKDKEYLLSISKKFLN